MFVVKKQLDEFSKLVSDVFPDSKLAKKYGAKKTKTSQIIKGERRGN